MVALRTNEMCLGGCDDCLGTAGIWPLSGGAMMALDIRMGAVGEVMVTLGTAGTEREGVILALGAAGMLWGHVRVALGTQGTEWEGVMVTLGTVGTQRGHMMVAWETEKAEQEDTMVALAIERTQWGVYNGDFGTSGTQWER